ncbi:hypothetical protein LIER_14166 [Lithospermum erythrorhizon]|uniref:Uncharacterized protein n=1 Tax=Lithospermum erythrorhizon TaxID=34254 RepID=A0AAV3Q0F6_LITER
MAGKMHDHKQHEWEAEANLRAPSFQEAPNTSKESPVTRLTPPHQASSISKEQPAKVVNAPSRSKGLNRIRAQEQKKHGNKLCTRSGTEGRRSQEEKEGKREPGKL